MTLLPRSSPTHLTIHTVDPFIRHNGHIGSCWILVHKSNAQKMTKNISLETTQRSSMHNGIVPCLRFVYTPTFHGLRRPALGMLTAGHPITDRQKKRETTQRSPMHNGIVPCTLKQVRTDPTLQTLQLQQKCKQKK